MVGYDLDGVVLGEPWWWRMLRLCQRIVGFPYKWILPLSFRLPLNIVPKQSGIIVTARLSEDIPRIGARLKELGIGEYPLYSSKSPCSVEEKAENIRRSGVTVFYESSRREVRFLRKSCPGVDVRLFRKRNYLRHN